MSYPNNSQPDEDLKHKSKNYGLNELNPGKTKHNPKRKPEQTPNNENFRKDLLVFVIVSTIMAVIFIMIQLYIFSH